ALERAHGAALDLHVDAIAHHFFNAAPRDGGERAIEYAVRAAERAAGQTAYEEAVLHYERALALLGQAPAADGPQRRTRVLLALARVQNAAGDVISGRQTLLNAAAVAESLLPSAEGAQLLADAALDFGGSYFEGLEDPDRIVLLQRALATCP